MTRVQVAHASSPICHWSWGYESVLNRIGLVYGDQVDIIVGQALPYTDHEEWLKEYEMTEPAATQFLADAIHAGGIPARTPHWREVPHSCLPATLAVKAAGIHAGPRIERHLLRRLQHATHVDGLDTADERVISSVVRAAGLEPTALAKLMPDAERALEADAERLGHGANFFSLMVRDDSGHSVALPQAYDPRVVEAAVDKLSPGLKKSEPRGILAYVKENGPVSSQELRRVFGKAMDAEMKDGASQPRERHYAGLDATFWEVAP